MILVGTAFASSWGLLGGMVATRCPARHDASPAWGTWIQVDRSAWTAGLDLQTHARGSFSEPWIHHTRTVRLGSTFGPGAGGDVAHTGIGVGPALLVRQGVAGTHGFVVVDPAVRVLTHLDVHPLEAPLDVRIQTGATVRGLRKWDFDVALGVGVAW